MKRSILVLLAAVAICAGAAASTNGKAATTSAPGATTAATGTAATAATSAAAKGEPRLSIVHYEHDFGPIDPKGGVVYHDFMVRNAGTAPLVVIKAYTDCSCTEAKVPRKPIMPGDSAAIRVSYDPKNQTPGGAIFKVIYVTSNDPAKNFKLTIRVAIK